MKTKQTSNDIIAGNGNGRIKISLYFYFEVIFVKEIYVTDETSDY